MIEGAVDQRGTRSEAVTGVTYGVAAYLWWGLSPLYFKAVAHVGTLEILAHRVTWSVVMLLGMLVAQRRWSAAVHTVRHRRTAITLVCSTALIAVNWLTFIWAVGHDRVLEASLGYFINPLFNVALGLVFLREKLRRLQVCSVLLAAAGVLYLTVSYGKPPWVSFVLAGSFGLYGLLRKTMRADALVGLAAETALLSPLAAGYLVFLVWSGNGAFGAIDWQTNALLLSAGVVTFVPLLWFANAARRLQYTTVGLLQYIAPSCQFLLAILVFGETLTSHHMIAFGCIWTALVVYSTDTALVNRSLRRGKETTG